MSTAVFARRHFLRMFPALMAWLGLGKPAIGAAPRTLSRVRPTDPTWPTRAQWQQLATKVGDALIPVRSPLSACAASRDEAACERVSQ